MSKSLTNLPVFKVGPRLGHDLIFGLNDLEDIGGVRYQRVEHFLMDEDFYQGLNMVFVIERISDGKKFGYSYWDDISKYGETQVESNGYEFGLEEDEDDDCEFYVFEPVGQSYILTYEFSDD